MPEAIIICLDASEYMRNGDFHPCRFEAQKEACNIICTAKTEQNRENEVGLLQMFGEGKATVLRNCTTEVGTIWNAAHRVEIKGRTDILVALQTAQLALKHRKNKKQSQRIIVFMGSPCVNVKKDLIKAAKRLKKNKVAVDIISFGEIDTNQELLETFYEKVNSNNNSHLISVPRGSNLGDAVISSPICVGDSGAAVPSSAAANNFPGGVDPNVDPDLAMVLRISMEEERARQMALKKAAEAEAKAGEGGAEPQGNGAAPGPSEEKKEEAGASAAPAPPAEGAEGGGDMEVDDDDFDEDEALAKAIAMSMAEENTENVTEEPKPEAADEAVRNPEFIDELLGDLPGMEKDDVALDELLDMVEDDEPKKEGKDEKKGS